MVWKGVSMCQVGPSTVVVLPRVKVGESGSAAAAVAPREGAKGPTTRQKLTKHISLNNAEWRGFTACGERGIENSFERIEYIVLSLAMGFVVEPREYDRRQNAEDRALYSLFVE
jgi:hypothetical protein